MNDLERQYMDFYENEFHEIEKIEITLETGKLKGVVVYEVV